jgi:hypothetical protein
MKNQHGNKISIAEMKMLNWMCGKTRHDRIRNDDTRDIVWVKPKIEKMMETRFRGFKHVERKHANYVVRIIEQMEGSEITRGGERLRKAIR